MPHTRVGASLSAWAAAADTTTAFLARYRGGTVLLCREKLIREEIPVEPHDFPVPWVLTERGLYEDGVPARLG